MCGITGLLDPALQDSAANRAALAQANDRLAHRGPDDAGLYLGDGVGLAARRLSILDLAGGHQPLSNEDGTIWVTFNGEIVNTPALRQELLAAGHQLRTHSDTELIVHAYEDWGTELLTHLRGMFAFGLWDHRRRCLLLARDRFGMKPLYYAQAGQRFAFASEIAPLLALLPNLPRRPDLAALWRLFEVGYIPTPHSGIAGVYKLPAAHYLLVQMDATGPHPGRVTPYWQLAFPPAGAHTPQPAAQAAAAFLAQLQDAVAAWRLSDVPVGSLLSGGLDSSSLARLLSDHSRPIHTFHIGFAAASHDESAAAQLVAQAIGSQHHTQTFAATAFDDLPALLAHLQEPQCAATCVPIARLYQACHAAGFKVILTGEGADELLGGYHWFDGDRRLQPWLALPRPGRALLARLPLPISPAGRRVLAQGSHDIIQRFAAWHEVTPLPLRRALLPGRPPPAPITTLWQAQYGASLAGRHPLDQFLYLETHTRLPDFINFEVDRMSMAYSVEARPPFLDHHLWEFCAGLPPALKLGPAGDKLLLRQAMAGRLPPAIVQRPKQGLASPHAAWWRSPRLPEWAETLLTPAGLQHTGYFDAATVQQLRHAHQAGQADHSRSLMGMLTTQLWHQIMGITH